MSTVLKLREFNTCPLNITVDTPSPTPQTHMDAAIRRLRDGARTFAGLSLNQHIRLAESMQQGYLRVAERMVRAGCKAKGITPGAPAEAEEWATGALGVVRQLRLVRESLHALKKTGNTAIGPVTEMRDGRLAVRAFPGNAIDGVLFKGMTADVHMQSGINRDTLETTRAVPDQLGLQVIVQPHKLGALEFGYATSLQTGKRTKPGAFSMTFLQVRSDEEVNEVRNDTRRIFGELTQMPGFISTLTAVVGHRMYTLSAWETAEASRQVLQGGAHKEAMNRFYNSNLASAGVFGVCVPVHNGTLVRCTACIRMMNYEKSGGKCECGNTLPEPPPYW